MTLGGPRLLGLLALVGVLLVAQVQAAPAKSLPGVLIGGPANSQQAAMAKDIARELGPVAGIRLNVRSSAGSPDTLVQLRSASKRRGVNLGLLQSDVMAAYQAAGPQAEAATDDLLAPLRVITPLHEELVYFITRSDAPINSVHEIADSRINIGPVNGGTALTAATLYRLMFDSRIPPGKASFLPHQKALVSLITQRKIDVVVIVAPTAEKLLADMTPEARRFIKLLAFDPLHPSAPAVTSAYQFITIGPSTHPNLLASEQGALALRLYLVTRISEAPNVIEASEAFQHLASAWCAKLPAMRASNPARWDSVLPTATTLPTLTEGWHYLPAVEQVLQTCP